MLPSARTPEIEMVPPPFCPPLADCCLPSFLHFAADGHAASTFLRPTPELLMLAVNRQFLCGLSNGDGKSVEIKRSVQWRPFARRRAAVIDGFCRADVPSRLLTPGLMIRRHRGPRLAPGGWQKSPAADAPPYTAPNRVFWLRKGNPKAITDLDDPSNPAPAVLTAGILKPRAAAPLD